MQLNVYSATSSAVLSKTTEIQATTLFLVGELASVRSRGRGEGLEMSGMALRREEEEEKKEK